MRRFFHRFSFQIIFACLLLRSGGSGAELEHTAIQIAAAPPQSRLSITTTSVTLRLTGIVFIGGRHRIYMAKEERGQLTDYLSRDEGVTDGTLEVRAVDPERGEVHVVWNGQDTLLSFHAQDITERTARLAEKHFVEEHTRAHEELQRREKERLAREQAESAL